MENNLNITKPCYSEHIVPVPWPFVILRCHCIIHKQGRVQGELHYRWCTTFVLGQQEKNNLSFFHTHMQGAKKVSFTACHSGKL